MKRLNFKGFGQIGLIAICFAIAGCQTGSRVQSEFDPEANFADYTQFAILPLPDTIPGANPGTMIRLRDPAIETIREVMAEKGYTEVEQDQADFGIYLRGEIQPKVKVTDWGYSGYTASRWGSIAPYQQIQVDQYNEGALILEIYGAKSKELEWVGWVKGRTGYGEVDIERFQAEVKNILMTFPPGSEVEPE